MPPLTELELEALELELEAAEVALLEAEAAAAEQSEGEAEGVRIAEPDDEEQVDAPLADEESEALAAAAEAILKEAMAEQAQAEADEKPLETSIDRLVEVEDVHGLLRLARAHRNGTGGAAISIKKCYEACVAAAELGSPDGKFRSALFHLSGVVVNEDLAEGMTRLRAAAKAGSERAKLYLANAYELGIGREAEPDKADVWYRGVARSRDIEAEEDDPDFVKAMAELGSIRHARIILRDEDIPKKDRLSYLRIAKPLGYALMQRNRKLEEAERKSIELEVEKAMEAAQAPDGEEAPPDQQGAPAADKKAKPEADKTEDKADKKEDAKAKPKPVKKGQERALGERFQAFGDRDALRGLGDRRGHRWHGRRQADRRGGQGLHHHRRQDRAHPAARGARKPGPDGAGLQMAHLAVVDRRCGIARIWRQCFVDAARRSDLRRSRDASHGVRHRRPDRGAVVARLGRRYARQTLEDQVLKPVRCAAWGGWLTLASVWSFSGRASVARRMVEIRRAATVHLHPRATVPAARAAPPGRFRRSAPAARDRRATCLARPICTA